MSKTEFERKEEKRIAIVEAKDLAKERAKEVPSIEMLYKNKGMTVKKTVLATLLNKDPEPKWIENHPFIKVKDPITGKKIPLQYLPIERIEWLMVSIFKGWRVEIKTVQLIGNGVVVTVRVWFLDPLAGDWDFTDGVGAQPLATEKGAGATDWNKLNTMAVQMATPAAESYAIKDACEKLGKLFGKDLNRDRNLGYNHLEKQAEKIKNLENVLEDKSPKPEP